MALFFISFEAFQQWFMKNPDEIGYVLKWFRDGGVGGVRIGVGGVRLLISGFVLNCKMDCKIQGIEFDTLIKLLGPCLKLLKIYYLNTLTRINKNSSNKLL
jgi:hypothetical protein